MVKRHKKYRITVEDESCLENIGQWTVRPGMILVGVVIALVCSIFIGFVFVLLTPAKRLIPGYYQPSQRAASEEAMLRVDSVMSAYERNNAYLSNILSIFADERKSADSVSASSLLTTLTPDSLLPISSEETKFNRVMQEREKFNIAIVAPIAAEGMLFYSIADDVVVTAETRDTEIAHVLLPGQSPVMAMADGVIIDVSGTPASGGYNIILQHNNGFVSKYSGLGTLVSGAGDLVTGGQIVGLSANHGANKPSYIGVRMWHNGNPLIPYKYISGTITL